jgi:predicted nicotinamide N-methyase
MEFELAEQTVRVAGIELSLLRPPSADALIDEDAFDEEEFLPYWAELWPAGLALAEALPHSLAGRRVIELGCGLGIPALVAAARGARVLATDWSGDALALLETNAARNGVALETARVRWDEPGRTGGGWDLVLAADVLYEHRNVPQLLALLPRLGAEVLLAEPGRPPAEAFFREAVRDWKLEELGGRVYRLTRRVTIRPSAPSSRAGSADPA